MQRVILALGCCVLFAGCGDLIDVDEPRHPPPGPPVVGQLPLELTAELQAAGVQSVTTHGGPWTFRRDPEGYIRQGDLLQVEVMGVPGLEKRYIEYVDDETFWRPENVRPIKTLHRTQQGLAEDFPRNARIPPTPGLQIRMYGPYSTDCFVIGGEVRHWGFYLWREGLTLQQALACAGGPRREMPNGKVHVVRGDRRVTLLLKDVLAGTPRPFVVKPMDEISVVERQDVQFDARKLGVPLIPSQER